MPRMEHSGSPVGSSDWRCTCQRSTLEGDWWDELVINSQELLRQIRNLPNRHSWRRSMSIIILLLRRWQSPPIYCRPARRARGQSPAGGIVACCMFSRRSSTPDTDSATSSCSIYGCDVGCTVESLLLLPRFLFFAGWLCACWCGGFGVIEVGRAFLRD